ncbi:fimbrial protein, partial [Stenotrophomonas sp. HMWF022]
MNPKIRLLALSLLAAVAAPAFAENLEITGELLTSTCAVQSTGGTI